MEKLIEQYRTIFKSDPVIIGVHWDNPEIVIDGITKAIKDGEPYDEYKTLSHEDQIAYDRGELVF